MGFAVIAECLRDVGRIARRNQDIEIAYGLFHAPEASRDGHARHAGNVGGQPFERHRSEEFAARPGPGGRSKAELLAGLAATVTRCRETIRSLSADELARVRRIQKYGLDGYRALFHTVEHMSYHTGQIVLLAKLQGVALDFYPQHQGE